MAGRQSAAPGGRKSDINRKQSVNQAPGGKAQKSDEKFPPPDIESLQLDDDFLFRSALQNDYATICGAFDAKEHPLALYLVEKSLFNKRNEFGKTVFDLAAKLGHRDFIRTILDRTNDKIDELVFSLRTQLKQKSAPYNFMHYACIWNRYDLVKYLAEHPKLIIDPNLDSSTEIAALTMTAIGGGNKNQQQLLASNPYAKTLGSILLRSKAKTGERPLDMAKRYNYHDLVVYLDYAGK
jgi:ankyrin repeat protein